MTTTRPTEIVTTVRPVSQSDEQVVVKARRAVAAQGKLRWGMLLYAALFLGVCGYFTCAVIRQIDSLDPEQLKMGFVYGLALALCCTSFGIMGGLFLGKFLGGFRSDFRTQELLISYHDRLRDLGQLPNEQSRESDHPAKGSQPVRSEATRT